MIRRVVTFALLALSSMVATACVTSRGASNSFKHGSARSQGDGQSYMMEQRIARLERQQRALQWQQRHRSLQAPDPFLSQIRR